MNNNVLAHKDCSPEKTINTIRNILSEIGIFPYESMWYDVSDNFYSVRIEDENTLGKKIGTNGKGLTHSFALASAYSEFMERLQNGFLFEKHFGLMNELKLKHSDVQVFDTDVILEKHQEIINYLFPSCKNELRSSIGDKIACAPYYNTNDDKVEYLPESLIKNLISTNGMTAGNTTEEALVQGICEIFERYALKKILTDNLKIPTIPLELIKHLSIFDKIQKLINEGYQIIIKDCSFSGTIPVIAVVMLNKFLSKALVNFGSDPTFEIALQRCFTEIFQGVNNNNLDTNKMIKFNVTDLFEDVCEDVHENPYLISFYHFQLGQVLNSMILSEGKPEFTNAFEKKFSNNKKSLKFLLKKIKSMGFNVFIRDVSYLGYPSYHIYIPGLSERYDSYEEVFLARAMGGKRISKILLNLKKSPISEIKKSIKIIEHLLEFPNYKFRYSLKPHNNSFISDSTNIILKENSDLVSLNLEYLLALLNFRIGDYKNAYSYLNLHLEMNDKYNIPVKNEKYYKCTLVYFKLKSTGCNEDYIYKTLYELFGVNLCNEVIKDLNNPENAFKYLNVPECGNCGSCPTIGDCSYEKWKNLVLKLTEKMEKNPIDQTQLKKILN